MLRLLRFDFPLSNAFVWGDGTRDYLISSHIVKYQELPRFGPFNYLQDEGIHGSPVYFYLLSLILLIYNSPLALSFLNIILQTVAIILIFLISKKLFDESTGLMAASLYSFNLEILHFADYIWQPNLMLIVVLLSLYFFIHLRFNASLMLLGLAVAIHSSALPWIPPFLLMIRPVRRMIISGMTLILVLIISHLPVLVNLPKMISLSPDLFNFRFGQQGENIQVLLQAANFNPLITIVLLGLLGCYLVTKYKHDKVRWTSFLFILTLFVAPIMMASLLNKVRLHYLTLSLVMFPVVVAVLISTISGNLKIRLTVFAIFFLSFSTGISSFTDLPAPLENYRLVTKMTDQLMSKLPPDFQVRTYAASGQDPFYYPLLDTLILVPLEIGLDRKLAEVADNTSFSHRQLSTSGNILLGCLNVQNELQVNSCLNKFRSELGYQGELESLFTDDRIVLFLARKL